MAGGSKRALPRADANKPRPAKRRATMIPTEGRVELVKGPANSRLLAFLVGNYLLRIDRLRRELYFGDLDLAQVGEVIGAAGVEPGMRDAAFRDKYKYFDKVVNAEDVRSARK